MAQGPIRYLRAVRRKLGQTLFELSLIQGDPFFRLQRRIGLIPHQGLGLIRRALFFALLAWLPIAVWAVLKGRAMPGGVGEPLLQHYGIHFRFLVAVPLLIFVEGMAHRVTTQLIPYFLTSGLVRDEQRGQFRKVLEGIVRLRNSSHPWVVIVAWVALGPSPASEHELIWTTEGEPASLRLGFGSWWLAYMARPIFVALLVAWLWRLVLAFLLLKLIAALNLALVPTHPDRAGGLGFLEKLPSAFSLFAFAVSAVLAARLAQEVVYHGGHVVSLKAVALVFLIIVVVLCLAPLLVFIPKLEGAKRRAVLEYGALIGEHGRLVHRRWIQREPVDESPLLDAPELGPVADTLSLYEAVTKMRTAPLGKTAITAIALPAGIPLLALFAIVVPIKDMLLKILSSLA
ncbi:hypothetical protein [Methyloterricola oryzae]|uniref:hypothetical protein n=1 Tax=Methyloterricola oryzae TaxID=1495050 RepID=UPI00069BB265|nr:hypothetical protein [Methyloterricola oryzae]